ncbi:MAG: hypothetical protein OHK0013_47010 [Sandaracinaceae bacterium]
MTDARRQLPPVIASLLAGLVLAAFVLAPLGGRAQTATVPAVLAGSWVPEGGVGRGTQVLDAAFAPSIAALPEIMHGFARSRIRDDMPVARRIVISLDGPRVRVSLESDHPRTIIGPLGARAATTGVSSGTTVTQRLAGGWLELVYEGEGSELRQLFSTEPDGARMHLDSTVRNGQLAGGMVRFRIEYVREGR